MGTFYLKCKIDIIQWYKITKLIEMLINYQCSNDANTDKHPDQRTKANQSISPRTQKSHYIQLFQKRIIEKQ